MCVCVCVCLGNGVCVCGGGGESGVCVGGCIGKYLKTRTLTRIHTVKP